MSLRKHFQIQSNMQHSNILIIGGNQLSEWNSKFSDGNIWHSFTDHRTISSCGLSNVFYMDPRNEPIMKATFGLGLFKHTNFEFIVDTSPFGNEISLNTYNILHKKISPGGMFITIATLFPEDQLPTDFCQSAEPSLEIE